MADVAGVSTRYLLLDTDVASVLFSRKGAARDYDRAVVGRNVALSFVTVGEMLHGAYKNKWGTRRLDALERYIFAEYAVLPYSVAVSRRWADLVTTGEAAGIRMEDNDAWIAASAVTFGCELLSRDRIFSRLQSAYPELRLVELS